MNKSVLSRLALATMPALITLTAMTASPAAAVTNIDACQTLAKFGETYRVTQDLSSCGTDCLVVANDRITIDLQGHQIASECGGGMGITDAGIARVHITVKNGGIFSYINGIDLGVSRYTTVRDVEAGHNDFNGILVGDQSLVKDCFAHHSGGFGISGLDHVQVQGCRVSNSGGNGIMVRDLCLITENEASDNNETGIAAGERCTVSHNVAFGNGLDGIDAGIKSLVTANQADFNSQIGFGESGIQVACPSTVTNNIATGNDVNYEFVGAGCHASNNKE